MIIDFLIYGLVVVMDSKDCDDEFRNIFMVI